MPAVRSLLQEVQGLDGVTAVQSPLDVPAKKATQTGLLSPDGSVGRASVVLEGEAQDVDVAVVRSVIDATQGVRADGADVGLAGQVLQGATTEPPASSEAIGMLVAAVVLLIAFGSVVAAGLRSSPPPSAWAPASAP